MELFVLLVAVIILIVMINIIANANANAKSSKISPNQVIPYVASNAEESDSNTSISELVRKSAFVAIDFETANSEISSACSLGLAFSNGSRIIGTKHYYIKPIPSHFDPVNIAIHGITPEMVESAPTFYELWQEIDDIEMLPFVAHNADFDANVMRQAFNIGAPDPRYVIKDCLEFFCTRNIARNIFDLSGYKLDDVCAHLNINLDNHHNATADAIAAAEIVHGIIKRKNIICIHVNPLYDLASAADYTPKSMDQIKHLKPFGKN